MTKFTCEEQLRTTAILSALRLHAVKISEKSMRLLEELVDIPKESEPGLEDFRFNSAMKEVGG